MNDMINGIRLTSANSVAICVCTFCRPKQLSRLLFALRSLARPQCTSFVIVDNDGSDPAIRSLVEDFHAAVGVAVEYIVERRPGISAARNTAVATARRMGAELIAMLDDDEWPSRDWLLSLLAARQASQAIAVGGPVQPVFDAGSSVAKKFEILWSVREGRLNGKVYVYCTCNCLLDLAAIAFLGDRPFPEDFGISGGEDSVFFRRLFFAGVRMAWAKDALVFEEIPPERASLAWMRRRWYRHGNVGLWSERAAPGHGSPPSFLKTILLCARFPIYPVVTRSAVRDPFLWVLEAERIRGRIAAHFGSVSQDYVRTTTN
jgi:succinoglycan biosynthesis protein ExoM